MFCAVERVFAKTQDECISSCDCLWLLRRALDRKSLEMKFMLWKYLCITKFHH